MKYAVPPWMKVVEEELNKNTKEIPGPEDNPEIVKYHQSCTLKATDDETPWCSAFVNWAIQNCGLGYEGTKSAQAISWLDYGTSLQNWRYGAIAVINNGNGTGHVTFFLCIDEKDDNYGYFVGGNQDNQLKISRYALDSFEDIRWPSSFQAKGGY